MLPDGEPVQLTNDGMPKLSPVFSPDGLRIAYGTVSPGFEWDMWTVLALGGEPHPWVQNVSGLVWSGPGRILFSEIKKNPHIGVVTAEESRIDQRDLYVPDHERGLAHRSTHHLMGSLSRCGNGSQLLLDAMPLAADRRPL